MRAIDPVSLDALDGHVLVLEGVTADHDGKLSWVRRAPCVVIGVSPDGAALPSGVDVALRESDGERCDAVADRVLANPHAARVLIDVLRAMPGLDVPTGLALESFAYSTLLNGPEHRRWLSRQSPRPQRSFDEAPLRVERAGEVLLVTLSRPENRNAFSAAMRDALFESLTLAEVDLTIEQVVVRGDGPVFCSGGDLTEFGTTPDVVRAHEIRTQRSIGGLLHRLRGRARVHVHGACIGAGVELPAFAAHVSADPASSFRLPEVAMGLIPGAGGTVSLTRRIGRQRTALFALLGQSVDAHQALELGLVDAVVDS